MTSPSTTPAADVSTARQGGNDTIVIAQTWRDGLIVPRVPSSRKGYVKHVRCEGSRFHVLSYGSRGVWCSEPTCIINAPSRRKGDNQ